MGERDRCRRALVWLLLGLISLASCGLFGASPAPLVILDEAFVSSRPGLARELRLAAGARNYHMVTLQEGPGRLIDLAKAAGYAGTPPTRALVTSPLLAQALAREDGALKALPGDRPRAGDLLGIAALGGAPLVVPAYLGQALDPIRGVLSDSQGAYAAAGRACGAYIASLAGGSKEGAAILYRAGRTEDEEGARAFAAAYRGVTGSDPLVERIPDEGEEAGIARLQEKDLAVVLVGPGLSLGLAMSKLARPGLALGLVLDDQIPGFPPGGGPAFCIQADLRAMARLTVEEARGLSLASALPRRVPALLLFDPAHSPVLGLELAKEGAKKSKFEKKPGSRS